ncbi:cilia- and flagella-associated protein 53-like [Stegodyphus dumicola]|uniref:cilia- and flagella-associated protein 53-like n=1 Tax=Stegodyphus dumicola TaxID=202533 RepID=UPI0015A97A80|nr:cilia- and flagella-associated protein 53-like [Stegodyphus dumicola]
MAFSAQNHTNPMVIEATGYAPYIKARAQRAAADGSRMDSKANRQAQAIRDYWNRQNFLDDISEYAKLHDRDLFRNQWECAADKKSLYSRVQWEVDKVTAKMDEELERRRTRLNDLLKAEEQKHLQAIEPVPQVVDSQALLERYKELKVQKEMERQKVAKEKEEQQFRRNCDELRNLMSRKIQKLTVEDGKRIAQEAARERAERNREENMYADLWVQDTEAKRQREEKEEEVKKARDKENVDFVKAQILQKAVDKQKALREKENDAILMGEQKRLADLEEAYEKERRRRKQEETRRDLSECLRAKLKRKTKEVQDDLLTDLFFLRQIMDDEEEARKNEKKKALMKEQQAYLQYLRDQIRKEEEFEKDIDKMYQEELEKMWAKREKEWQAEKEKRRKLEQDIMKEVKEQITANEEKVKKVQEMSKLYAQEVLKEDEEDKKREEEKLRLIREKHVSHQKDLLEQIRTKEEKLKAENLLRDKELEALARQRELQEARIQKLLSDITISNEHPYRIHRRELCKQEI